MPSAPMVRNHSTITGPKKAPTRAVPWLWMRNRPAITPIVIGITNELNTGVATSRPSIAPSTEIAGVIMLSP